MKIPVIDFDPSVSPGALLEIVDLESIYTRREQLDHDPEQPHRVQFSLLLYIQKGEGAHFVDFQSWPFASGSLIFINKNQIHAFDLSNKPQGKAVVFTDEYIQKLQSNMKMPVFSPDYLKPDYSPGLQLEPDLQQSCERLLDEIEKETRSGQDNSLVSMYLFSALFLLLERQRQKSAEQLLSRGETVRFAKFIHLLELHFSQTRNASDYADALHVTYKTLNLLCKKASGQSAKQLIDAYTLLEAKRCLIVENQKVQELAYHLGFDEVTNFTKYFKKHTGQTPSSFQKNR